MFVSLQHLDHYWGVLNLPIAVLYFKIVHNEMFFVNPLTSRDSSFYIILILRILHDCGYDYDDVS